MKNIVKIAIAITTGLLATQSMAAVVTFINDRSSTIEIEQVAVEDSISCKKNTHRGSKSFWKKELISGFVATNFVSPSEFCLEVKRYGAPNNDAREYIVGPIRLAASNLECTINVTNENLSHPVDGAFTHCTNSSKNSINIKNDRKGEGAYSTHIKLTAGKHNELLKDMTLLPQQVDTWSIWNAREFNLEIKRLHSEYNGAVQKVKVKFVRDDVNTCNIEVGFTNDNVISLDDGCTIIK